MKQKVNDQNFWLFINKRKLWIKRILMVLRKIVNDQNFWLFINILNTNQKNLAANEAKSKQPELLAVYK